MEIKTGKKELTRIAMVDHIALGGRPNLLDVDHGLIWLIVVKHNRHWNVLEHRYVQIQKLAIDHRLLLVDYGTLKATQMF